MIRMLQVGVLGLGLALAVGAMADDSAEPRKLTVEAVPMVQWTPPAPSSVLKPVMWMDRSDLLYRPGEYAKAFVRLNQDAYVTVLNVSADGQTTVLFPNQYVSDNRVRANATLELGTERSNFRLAVSEPYGGNVLKVIASDRPIDWMAGRTMSRSGPFMAVADKGSALARQLTVVAAAQPQAQLASAEIVFGVVPPAYAVAPVPQPAPAVPPVYQKPPVAIDPPPVAPPVPQPQPVPPVFPIPSALSDFGLRVAAAKPSYAVGEKIQVELVSERDCSLVLLDVRPDGQYQLLFPNAVDEELWLDAGETTFLANSKSDLKIEAAGPGAHTLLALCTANRTFSQWLFGKSTTRTQAVVKQPTLEEVMSNRPKGDAANASFVYTVQ